MFLKTPADLKDLLDKLSEIKKKPLKDIRYAIYVRKSTDEEGRQVRSLGDQLIECKSLAKRLNLEVVAVFQEKESAKEPDIRPKFRQMLDEIQTGKYEG